MTMILWIFEDVSINYIESKRFWELPKKLSNLLSSLKFIIEEGGNYNHLLTALHNSLHGINQFHATGSASNGILEL